MTGDTLTKHALDYLNTLCLKIPERPTGSKGNRMATTFAAKIFSGFGFDVEEQEFECLDWKPGHVSLESDGEQFQAHISPYSLACEAEAPLVVVTSVDELESAVIRGKILLMKGEIASSQLFPKNFPFLTIDEHQRIISLLENKQPAAIIAATSKNPELAGGIYPFPLFEDGDFNIPSLYMKDVAGDRLAELPGASVKLSIEAERIPARGSNVIARKTAGSNQRVAVWAHIDAKEGTPGALDNASGVATLFLLAELLAGYDTNLDIELTAINGEDYFSAAGQQNYLAKFGDSLHEIILGINIDGAGYINGPTAYSLYGCPDYLTVPIRHSFADQRYFVEGDPWYQSDHAIFVINERPALALTTSEFGDVWSKIAHTAYDKPDLVDIGKLIEIAKALRSLILAIDSLEIH